MFANRWMTVIALLVLFAVAQRLMDDKNEETERAVAEADGYAEWSETTATRALGDMRQAMDASLDHLRNGDPHAAGLVIYRRFPPFERLVQAHGFREVSPGVSLRDAFERAAAPYRDALAASLDGLARAAGEGDVSHHDVRTLASYLPPALGGDFRAAWSAREAEVRRAREANASGWFLVSVASTYGNFRGYEDRLKDALRAKWNDASGLKLVFGPAMSGAETAAAAKHLVATVDEERGRYEFGKGQEGRGSAEVPTAVIITFEDKSRPGASRTVWDALPPVTASHQPPETLRFQFSSDRQTADFSDVEAACRAALEEALTPALDAVPAFSYGA